MKNKQEDRKEEERFKGLPMKDSPYVQYADLEDYKMKAYGTHGHLEPKPGRGAGASVDAPTLSGGSVTSSSERTATDTINAQGVPWLVVELSLL